jgi:carbon storage regulator
MLVLSRKLGEKIHIGTDITITLVEVQGNRCRIGIEAPAEVSILRAELLEPSTAAGSGEQSARV